MATISRVVCDLCKEDLQPRDTLVAAGTCGVDVHAECFTVLTPWEVLRLLHLDDIAVGPYDRWDAVGRWWRERSGVTKAYLNARVITAEDIKRRVASARVAADQPA